MSKQPKSAAATIVAQATAAAAPATPVTPAQTSAVSVTIEGAILVVSFASGRVHRFDTAKQSEDTRQRAMMHGFKQKFVDGAAIPRDRITGRSATNADKEAAVMEIINRLETSGEWNATTRESSGDGGLLFRAMMNIYPDKGDVRIRAWLGKKTDAEKTALRNDPTVAAEINKLRAEMGKQSKVDTAALLREFADE